MALHELPLPAPEYCWMGLEVPEHLCGGSRAPPRAALGGPGGPDTHRAEEGSGNKPPT